MDDGFELTRRKALAGIGGIGVASAGAGLGTSAFFSDQERFEGNSLVAGELQLHGSWQQIYYGPEENADHYAPYGTAGRPWVNAHPDDTENGVQSLGDRTYVEDPRMDPTYGANIPLTCDDFEDLPEAPTPVIDLDDVKPGDWGEVTFSVNLCDNPGYLWMQSADVDSEDGPNEGTHLEDFVRAKVWYDDDCDNVPDGCKDADLMLMLDFSGSMFYDRYGGLISADEGIDVTGDGTDDYEEKTIIDVAERAIYQLIEELIELECAYNVGAVFANGYDGDHQWGGSGDANLKVVEPTTDLEGLIEDGEFVKDNVGDDPNEGGAFRNLRYQLVELTNYADDETDPDEYVWDPETWVDQHDVSTGTALPEGLEMARSVMDDNEMYENRHTITITDGEPYQDGSLTRERFEEVFEIANGARTGEFGDPTSFCVIGSPDGGGGEYTQKVIANVAGTEIDVEAAADAADDIENGGASLDDYDPTDVGGNLAYWYDLFDEDVATQVYDICLSNLREEYVIASGTLGDVLAALNSDGVQLFQYPYAGSHACFEPEETHCFGFKWWFDTGQQNVNDAQGDSLEFDLRFYAEQCRHNDDPSGPPSTND